MEFLLGLNDDEIIAEMLLFLLAGYSSPSMTLTFFVYVMATNPDIQRKCAAEVKAAVITELNCKQKQFALICRGR